MKKMILVFAFVSTACCMAQQIEMKKVFGGYKYELNGKRLSMYNLAKTVESNQQAYKLVKKAQTNRTIAIIMGCTGGGLIGYQTGTDSAGGKANWTLAGIGAGLLVVAIPISLSADKKTKQAVELYNHSLSTTSNYECKPELKLIANGKGVGLSMNF